MSRHIPIANRPANNSSLDIFQSPPRTLSASQGPSSGLANRPLSFSAASSSAGRPASAGTWVTGAGTGRQGEVGRTGVGGKRRPRSQVFGPSGEELVIRQWSSNAFEWTIRDLSALKRDIESTEEERQQAADDESGSRLHDLLQGGLLIGDDKFRLDVIVNQPPSPTSTTPNDAVPTTSAVIVPAEVDAAPTAEPTMNLYLALLSAERIPPDDPTFAAIFIGIKPIDTTIGRRDGLPHWVWTSWEDASFCSELDYWQCTLPALSTLLANPRIAEQDAFALVMQVRLPQVAAAIPHRPGMHLIAQDLLDGIAASLDNASTGDVRFVCLEHKAEEEDDVRGSTAGDGSIAPAETNGEEIAAMAQSTVLSTVSSPQLYRKRIIYAHKDILRHRSEYFRDLMQFDSDAQGTGPNATNALGSPTRTARSSESRQIHTIQCHDADFTTVYWLLHYLYTSELDFAITEDVRSFVSRKAERAQSAAKELVEPPKGMRLLAEWDWKMATQMVGSESQASRDGRDVGDNHTVRSAASISSVGTSISQRLSSEQPVATSSKPRTGTASTAGDRTTTARSRPGQSIIPPKFTTSTPSATSRATPTRIIAPTRPAGTTPTRIRSSTAGKTLSPTASLANQPLSHLPYPAHLHPARLPPPPAADPNPHPTPSPAPASALAIYSLAHCYRLTALQDLAQNHLMENLTPEAAMPLLLASFSYEDLYKQTQDYIVDNWAAVQAEPEFLACIQEVSGGSWGESGGMVLHGLFRRLHAAI